MKNSLILFFTSSILLVQINARPVQHSPSFWNWIATPSNRSSSYPYIAGDTFRAYCDFIIDNTNIPFDPSKVKPGNTIFFKNDSLHDFFTYYHPKIPCKYILITHNCDYGIPGKFQNYLDDNKLIAWFGQNVEYLHPKLIVIPCGIANNYWDHGDPNMFKNMQNQLPNIEKNKLVYMNFSIGTYPAERQKVWNKFVNCGFCSISGSKSPAAHLRDLAESKFVLSPRGNGLDCHRTWKALLMGCIPIVKKSTLDSVFEGLPVLLIDNWDEITQEFLEKQYLEIISKKYDMDRLYADYWFNKINLYKLKI